MSSIGTKTIAKYIEVLAGKNNSNIFNRYLLAIIIFKPINIENDNKKVTCK
jgi:hypothetical protein